MWASLTEIEVTGFAKPEHSLRLGQLAEEALGAVVLADTVLR